MIRITDENRSNCCGCTACKSVCPKQAISMLPDQEGFLTPVIDSSLCINCGLCDKVCPMAHSDKLESKCHDNVYVGALKDLQELSKSQSGGAFWALAKAVIQNEGIVYGCGYKGHFVAAHKRAETIEQCEEFRKSKYVQSDMGDCYMQIQEDLQAGRNVLFSGTPCQCAGLQSFLGKKYENLIVCDIICHGVPTPLLTEKYIAECEKQYGDKIVGFNYRYYDGVSLIWGRYLEKIDFSKGDSILATKLSNLYYSSAFLRKSCNICPFGNKATSDVTIADAWGCKNYAPGIENTNRGVSEILIHSKIEQIYGMLASSMNLVRVNYGDVSKYQPSLFKPTEASRNREKYMKMFLKKGILYTHKRMTQRARVKDMLLKLIGKNK